MIFRKERIAMQQEMGTMLPTFTENYELSVPVRFQASLLYFSCRAEANSSKQKATNAMISH
jgi:hypothetical protein